MVAFLQIAQHSLPFLLLLHKFVANLRKMALVSFVNCAFFTVIELLSHDPVKTADKLDY